MAAATGNNWRTALDATPVREVSALSASLRDITSDLRSTLDHGIFFDPWLAALTEESIEPAVDHALDRATREFLHQHWTPEQQAAALGTLPVTRALIHASVRETAMATHCLHAVDRGLPRIPRVDDIEIVFANLRSFAQALGCGAVVRGYLAVTAYENLLAIAHYGTMREEEFLSGQLHRPWVGHNLSDELLCMLAQDLLQLRIRDGQRHLALTGAGARRHEAVERQLHESGYFDRRVRAMIVAHFDQTSAQLEPLGDLIWPTQAARRRQLVERAAPRPGMRVLELGCGTGGLTIASGLAAAIAPGGELLALDSAAEMVQSCRRRARAEGHAHVRCEIGRAEAPPVADGSFDMVISSYALHFFDAPLALRSAYRKLRPGGTLALLWPLPFRFVDHPVLSDWFRPLLERMRTPALSGADANRFLTVRRATELVAASGFIEIQRDRWRLPSHFFHVEEMVRLCLFSLSLFQREIEQLPWAARRDLVDELMERGHRIVDENPAAATGEVFAGLVVARRPRGPAEELGAPVVSLAHRRAKRFNPSDGG